jgi:hypothetical protein
MKPRMGTNYMWKPTEEQKQVPINYIGNGKVDMSVD